MLLFSFNLIDDKKFKFVMNSTEKTLKIESILNILMNEKSCNLCIEKIYEILKLSYAEVILFCCKINLIYIKKKKGFN